MATAGIDGSLGRVDYDLHGHVALITGAGRGIGAVIAHLLSHAGAAVVLAGRTGTDLERTAQHIAASGGRAACVVADVRKEDDCARMVEQATTRFGRLTALVNNAGIAGPTKTLDTLSLAEWNEVITTNLTGVFLACRAAIPALRAAGGGGIVMIGSVTGKRPLPARTPYASAKLGLVGLTRSLAHELGPSRITVNLISPWLVAGPRLDAVVSAMAAREGREPAAVRADLVSLSPLRREVTELDVARLAAYLLSPGGQHMTGQDFNLSAGAVMY
jgi:NAD(P)-dependent dehydrogenase (short-subunit alcohol dehydrogenase family)